MSASRELDSLVAEKVMGISPPFPKPYSTDIAAAWEVVGKIPMVIYAPRTLIEPGRYNGAEWMVRAMDDGDYGDKVTEWVFAEAAPLAICKAALKAVGVEVPG